MQLVVPPHHRQIGGCHRPRLIIEAAAAQLQQRCLPGQRKFVAAVDHRFALNRPALLSAPDKKSFFSLSFSILACSAFKPTAGALSAPHASPPDTPAAPSRNWAFQVAIWFGCTSNRCANSASVLSPLIAGQCHLRLEGRRVVPSCSSRHLRSCNAAIFAALRQKRHLSCVRIPSATSCLAWRAVTPASANEPAA